MKKIILFLLAVLILLFCSACASTPAPESETINIEPKVAQMRTICQLATMDCYYHTVAKFTEKDAEGILWWTKDKHFWVEYSGVVTLGVDMSLVSIEVSDTLVTITLPEAKVLGCRVDSASLNKDSFYLDCNSASVTAEDEVAAFEAAEQALLEVATNDKALLASAQQQAQALLEEYIFNIGTIIGKEYAIKWIYLNSNGDIVSSNISEATTSTEPT